MTDASGAVHLRREFERAGKILQHLVERLDHDAVLGLLQRWQRARLRATYGDLAAQERYAAACEFFLVELYGGKHARERDRQLQKVLPIMRSMLPDPLLYVIGEALRLQRISLELDIGLADCLPDCSVIDQSVYARAYRRHGAWTAREEQICLIGKLGRRLDDTVRNPLIPKLVRLMRGPARAAGFGVLQGFLERGLSAFARMGGADEFIETIETRERQALKAIRSGAQWPFEPWVGRGPVLGEGH